MSEACGNDTVCSDSRGLTVNLTTSTSYNQSAALALKGSTGIFELDLDKDLGYGGPDQLGQYGQDSIGLSILDSGIKLKNQVIAGIITPVRWIGQFGLGDQPTNFSGFDHPQPSFLTTLYTEGKIPSLSWGYTAGASYRKNLHIMLDSLFCAYTHLQDTRVPGDR